MRTKDEILDAILDAYPTKARKAMDEYAAEASTNFLEWAYLTGWQAYDSCETWINLDQNNNVLSTPDLFKLFKKENNIQ